MRETRLPGLLAMAFAVASLFLAGCGSEAASPAVEVDVAKPSKTKKNLKFTQQFGTPGSDWGYGSEVDRDGNLAVAGMTTGVLEPGHVPVPGGEIFLAKFDPKGKMLWARQFAPGVGNGVAADAGGNLYVVGTSETDLIVAKFDALGNKVWEYRGGTGLEDTGESVTVGPDNAVYVTGRTGGVFEAGGNNRGGMDIFVAKFSPNDNVPVWLRQFGSPGQDFAESVAADPSGSVYVAGMSLGGFEGNAWNGGEDLILLKLSPVDGATVWARQYGTPDDEYGSGVTTDGNGNVYVLGYTDADFDQSGVPAAEVDLFLMKVDPASGNVAWSRQRRSTGFDQAEGLGCAGGLLVVAGLTTGDMGEANAGAEDAFLAAYDLSGNPVWATQMGTGSYEGIWGLSAGPDGNWYATGNTTGLLRPGEESAGGRDAFILKVDASGVPR